MSEANIATVQHLYAAFGRGDTATVLDACQPDIEWETVGRREDFPAFGRRKGKEELKEFFRLLEELKDFTEFAPREFYGDRDKVFVLGHYAVTMKKNGRQAASDWIHVIGFRGGKVGSFREFTDTAIFAEAHRG